MVPRENKNKEYYGIFESGRYKILIAKPFIYIHVTVDQLCW